MRVDCASPSMTALARPGAVVRMTSNEDWRASSVPAGSTARGRRLSPEAGDDDGDVDGGLMRRGGRAS